MDLMDLMRGVGGDGDEGNTDWTKIVQLTALNGDTGERYRVLLPAANIKEIVDVSSTGAQNNEHFATGKTVVTMFGRTKDLVVVESLNSVLDALSGVCTVVREGMANIGNGAPYFLFLDQMPKKDKEGNRGEAVYVVNMGCLRYICEPKGKVGDFDEEDDGDDVATAGIAIDLGQSFRVSNESFRKVATRIGNTFGFEVRA